MIQPVHEPPPLALDAIEDYMRLHEEVQAMEDPPRSVVRQCAQMADLLEDKCAVELAWMRGSQKQQRLGDAFSHRTHTVIAAVGANRSGKSWFAARLCAARRIRDEGYPGMLVWCISQSWKKSVEACQKELWEALPQDNFSREWDEVHGFGSSGAVTYRLGPDSNIKRRPGAKRTKRNVVTIRFFNEEQKLNVFESADPDFIWWDEASRESVFGRLLTRLIDKSGQLLISCLPQEVWLRMRIEESGNKRYIHQQFTTYDNEDNLPDGAIDLLAEGLTEEEKRMRIDGEYVTLTGLCFPEFVNMRPPDGHVQYTPLEIPTDENGRRPEAFVFIDPGLYTAALLLLRDHTGMRYVWDEVYSYGETPKEICKKIKKMLAEWDLSISELLAIKMDPAGWNQSASNELPLSRLYANQGVNAMRWIRTATFGEGERSMINLVRLGLENKTILINDHCVNTIREMRQWRWEMDDQQKPDQKEKTVDKDNHACDCLKAFIADDPGTLIDDEVEIVDTAHGIELEGTEYGWQEALV